MKIGVKIAETIHNIQRITKTIFRVLFSKASEATINELKNITASATSKLTILNNLLCKSDILKC